MHKQTGDSFWKSKVISLGAISVLSTLLDPKHSDVKRMLAVWALSNLAHDHGRDISLYWSTISVLMACVIYAAEAQEDICEAGVLQSLIVLLKETINEDIVEKVLWLLLNLARHSKNRYKGNTCADLLLRASTYIYSHNRSALGQEELVTLLAGFLDYDSSRSNLLGDIPTDALRWSQRIVAQASRALTNIFYEGNPLTNSIIDKYP